MRVLFLYTELASYFLKCCEELLKVAEVHVVCWPVNKEAPFKFIFPSNLKVYQKEDYSFNELKNLTTNINPSIIICSGWIDKDYLKITKLYFNKLPTVMSLDTHWNGSIKQYTALLLSRFFLLNVFSHAWVPGEVQKKYAQKLGFKTQNIRLGFYSCDLKKFNTVYTESKKQKEQNSPTRFLYVGRYYNFKGIQDLWAAFVQLQLEESSDWELWCLGTGDLDPIHHPKIKHFGFVQPTELEPILAQCSVFVLPSRYEPWGVVVHEYAASGFPLLLSKAVGAAEAFLQEGKNGFSFESGNIPQLKTALKKITKLSAKDLTSMSEKSHQLAQGNSPEKWAATVIEIHNESKKK